MRAGETFIMEAGGQRYAMLMMWCAEAPDTVTLVADHPAYAQMTASLRRQMEEQA